MAYDPRDGRLDLAGRASRLGGAARGIRSRRISTGPTTPAGSSRSATCRPTSGRIRSPISSSRCWSSMTSRRFHVTCYADVDRPDATTARLKDHADRWHETASLSDDELFELIRSDGIDILVDLAGHTANNRLPVFGRRAAPLQISWIGYPATTGLSQMDYMVTDAWADPPGASDSWHSENLLRLPEGFLCYGPPQDAPTARGRARRPAAYLRLLQQPLQGHRCGHRALVDAAAGMPRRAADAEVAPARRRQRAPAHRPGVSAQRHRRGAARPAARASPRARSISRCTIRSTSRSTPSPTTAPRRPARRCGWACR